MHYAATICAHLSSAFFFQTPITARCVRGWLCDSREIIPAASYSSIIYLTPLCCRRLRLTFHGRLLINIINRHPRRRRVTRVKARGSRECCPVVISDFSRSLFPQSLDTISSNIAYFVCARNNCNECGRVTFHQNANSTVTLAKQLLA